MRFKRGLARSRHFSDAREVASALPGVSMDVAMVDRATGRWNIAELDLGRLRLLRVDAGGAVSATAVVDENVFSFALPLTSESNAWTVNGCPSGRDQLAMFAPGTVYALFTPRALSWLSVRVDQAFFRRRYHAIFGRHLVGTDVRVVPCGQQNARRLRRAHAGALALLEENARTLRDERSLRALEEVIVMSLLQALAGSNDETQLVRALPSRLPRLLRADAAGPVDLGHLRSGLGTSERTLRRAFRQLLGVSPARYLRVRRLHQARDALKVVACGTVTQVAASLGFSDFGRFAREYCDLFGELPSATLKRAGAPKHPPS
jgi:AraC family transcriptional regulator, ethanolamine operon transcriptional activator